MAQVRDVLKMTPAEFEAYATHPDNADRKLELIGGEVVEVVSDERSTSWSMRIAIEIGIYLKQNPIGYLTDAQSGFSVGDNRFMPDVGFVLFTTSPRPGVYHRGLSLAVEVLSPSDQDTTIADKVFYYTHNGTETWVVDPEAETLTVYRTDGHSYRLRRGDVLAGDPLLPGLNLPINDIFIWPGQMNE